ncbi:MAG: hypothetical protein QME07_06640 [bacterium]|nr:hypothetical protein [bacterium]
MRKEEIVKKNLDLHAEWMKYAFENPDILDKIPKGAALVILPEDDPELYMENSKIMEEYKKRGLPFVVLKMKTPKLITPKIEVSKA